MEFHEIWTRAVLNPFLLCKNEKSSAQLNIFPGWGDYFLETELYFDPTF